jgi:hypothetical protein
MGFTCRHFLRTESDRPWLKAEIVKPGSILTRGQMRGFPEKYLVARGGVEINLHTNLLSGITSVTKSICIYLLRPTIVGGYMKKVGLIYKTKDHTALSARIAPNIMSDNWK